MLTVTVVIPVRNDAAALQVCLDALRRQDRAPDRVVVVDDRSTDDSAAVAAARHADVVDEQRVGIAVAAATGYDAVDTDLVLRLDADSIPPVDWIARIVQRFSQEPGLAALSGPGVFATVPGWARHVLTGWYWRCYFDGLRRAVGATPLFGSNLAMRTTAWRDVSGLVHRDDLMVHDDLDLSIHLHERGHRTDVDPDLRVVVSARPLLHPFGMVLRARRATHTLALHGRTPRLTLPSLLAAVRPGAARLSRSPLVPDAPAGSPSGGIAPARAPRVGGPWRRARGPR